MPLQIAVFLLSRANEPFSVQSLVKLLCCFVILNLLRLTYLLRSSAVAPDSQSGKSYLKREVPVVFFFFKQGCIVCYLLEPTHL